MKITFVATNCDVRTKALMILSDEHVEEIYLQRYMTVYILGLKQWEAKIKTDTCAFDLAL